MTQHGTRSRTRVVHLTTEPTSDPDGYPQRKELREDVHTDENSEWIDDAEEAQEAHRQPAKANIRPTTSAETYRASPRKRGIRRAGQTLTSRKQGSVPSFPNAFPPSPKVLASSPKASHPARHETQHEIRDAVLKGLSEGTKFSVHYMLNILKTVTHLSRYPIAIFITIFLLVLMMGYISTSIRRAFEPLCIIPGISSLSVCNPDPRTSSSSNSVGDSTPKWADYSKLMDMQTQSFEQLLGDTAGGSALSLEIKKAEMATKDLITLVRISDLKAKDILVTSLSEFVEDAEKAGRSLQTLASKAGGAVDSIMAVNDYALQSIASARANEPPPWSLKGLISRATSVDEVVRRTFEEAMNVLSAHMERLILEAEYNHQLLKNLEERLATLHEIVAAEDSSISSAHSDLLEDLWTKLGRNRKAMKNFQQRLALLKGLGTYRRQALAHVAGALQTLRAMGADMEDMRERVALPELMGPTVPVEVHMKSIQMGLERLREGRNQAKALGDEAVSQVMGYKLTIN